MNITANHIAVGTGCSLSVANNWQFHLSAAMNKWGINTPKPAAAFLANIGVESGRLGRLVENLNYRADRMAAVWPSRYASRSTPNGSYARDPKGRLVPNALAISLAGRPIAIANNCYAGRNGNGPESSGDGWNFRGRGLIMITGRANYAAYAAASGVGAVEKPDLLSSMEYAADSSAWFFSANGCITLASAGSFDQVVKRINGQLPCETNDGALRKKLYDDVLKLLV